MKTRSVSEFFKNDLPSYASYDNIRKIPSMVDGLKISQRKLIWTGFKKASKEFIKTETFCNLTSLETAYIHGSANLCGVCDSLVQNFVGASNYAQFDGNSGGWGSRLIPRSAASRYTRLMLSKIAKTLFNEIDNEILEKQFFEGQYIEPKYLVPIFPVIFLNPSDGLSTGFSSHIYPRNPKEIISYLKKKLSGTENPRDELLPWFRGFKGKVCFNKELGVNECWGNIEKINSTKYIIHDIPVETSYQKYIEILDKLCDSGMIVDYDDKCNPKTDEILFEIKTTRDFTNKHLDERKLYEDLKLIKTLPEQLNCIDTKSCVKEYKDIKEILNDYIKIRYDLYVQRKAYLLKTFKRELERLVSKYVFCKSIIDKKLIVSNRKKDDIIADMSKIDKIIKVDDSYDYLLRMPIHSISAETMAELKKQIQDKKAEFDKIKSTSEKDMWISDLDEFSKLLTK